MQKINKKIKSMGKDHDKNVDDIKDHQGDITKMWSQIKKL